MGIVLPNKNSLPQIPQDRPFPKEIRDAVEDEIQNSIEEKLPVEQEQIEEPQPELHLRDILIGLEQRILNLEAALYRIKGAI